MNTSDPARDEPERGLSDITRLLAYRTPLDDGDFSDKVMAVATRRRTHRSWMMGGALALATVAALLIRPRQFDLSTVLTGLAHESASIAGSVLIGPMVLVLVVITLCLAASRPIENI